MNILSLFDGIGVARIALDRANIKVDNYYSSQVDKFAHRIAKHNYPDIISIGDVRNIDISTLPKIDLLIGGSPCQDLSIAGKQEGLKGEKSKLFYVYVEMLKKLKPKYFLLENVGGKYENMMSEIIGVDFTKINSNLFSAQSRQRLYWTNINFNKEDLPQTISQTNMKDIIERGVDEKYFYNKININDLEIDNNKKISRMGTKLISTIPKTILRDYNKQRRVYSIEGKSPTLCARSDSTKILIDGRIRKLTPLECQRLQTIPDNYTSICSNIQRYKAIGNAFTTDVIVFILKHINK